MCALEVALAATNSVIHLTLTAATAAGNYTVSAHSTNEMQGFVLFFMH